MADHKHKETRQLAHDCVTMTLHGPLPMETVAKLCQGVMDLYDENEDLRNTSMMDVIKLGQVTENSLLLAEALKEARPHVVRQEHGRHEQDRADSKEWQAKWGEKLKAMGVLK